MHGYSLYQLVTGGSDFEEFTDTLVLFTPENENQSICHLLPLINDEAAENSETFLLSLDANVMLGDPVPVTILDQDCELRHNVY